MKSQRISFPLVAALALGLTACNKNEPATPAADIENKAGDSTTAAAVAGAAETAEAEATKATEAIKAEALKAEVTNTVEITNAAQATHGAQLTNTEDSSKIQELIDKAKALVAESKFADASSVLQQLVGQTLTDKQKKLVDALKEQIQKALTAKAAENAAGSAGDLLNN